MRIVIETDSGAVEIPQGAAPAAEESAPASVEALTAAELASASEAIDAGPAPSEAGRVPGAIDSAVTTGAANSAGPAPIAEAPTAAMLPSTHKIEMTETPPEVPIPAADGIAAGPAPSSI